MKNDHEYFDELQRIYHKLARDGFNFTEAGKLFMFGLVDNLKHYKTEGKKDDKMITFMGLNMTINLIKKMVEYVFPGKYEVISVYLASPRMTVILKNEKDKRIEIHNIMGKGVES